MNSTVGTVGAVTLAIILVVGLIAGIVCIEKIPVGYEGVVYSMSGGVQGETLSQGWHMVAPTKKVKEFTISNEQLILTQDERDGSKGNEAFNVSTADNASISISFQMSYRFKSDKLVETYKKFKGMNGEDIINKRVKTVLKSKISEITTDYSMMDIYSGNRSEINKKITDYLNKEFEKTYGIEVMDASIVDVHPDEQLQKTINDRVTALQKKQQAEAEQEKIKVEAATKLIQANNEAEIKRVEAQAEADANILKSQSITQQLIDMKNAEARLKHGWIEVQGAGTVVATK